MKLTETAQVKYGGKWHEAVVKEAEVLFDKAVTDPTLRLKMARALEDMDQFSTYARQTSTAGSFQWWGQGGRSYKTAMELNMRRQVSAEVERWNAHVMEYNAKARALMADYQSGKIGQLTYQEEWAALKRGRAQKADYKLWDNASAESVADTMVHESFHAVDEASGFAYGASARKEIQAEVRAIARSADPQAKAFEYAAELKKPPRVAGVETAAETVRMYFMGTGDQASAWGIKPLTHLEWRAKYPKLAKWVEEVVLSE
jgi:hypothetical protein